MSTSGESDVVDSRDFGDVNSRRFRCCQIPAILVMSTPGESDVVDFRRICRYRILRETDIVDVGEIDIVSSICCYRIPDESVVVSHPNPYLFPTNQLL